MIRTFLVLLWAIEGQAYTSCTAFKEEWDQACPAARDLSCDPDSASVTTALAEVFHASADGFPAKTCGDFKDLYVHDCKKESCPSEDTIVTGVVSVPAFIWNNMDTTHENPRFVPAEPATVAHWPEAGGQVIYFTVRDQSPCIASFTTCVADDPDQGFDQNPYPTLPFGDLNFAFYSSDGGALSASLSGFRPYPHCYMLDRSETSDDRWLYCRSDPKTAAPGAFLPYDSETHPIQTYLEGTTDSYVYTVFAKLPPIGALADVELYMGLAIGEDLLRQDGTMQMSDFDRITYYNQLDYQRMGGNMLLRPYPLLGVLGDPASTVPVLWK